MTISLSKEGCSKNNITISEVLLLLCFGNDVNFEETKSLLIKKGFITSASLDNSSLKWRVTNKGTEILNSVIIDSEKEPKPKDQLTEIAAALKGIFPKGKKDGTNYYWAEGVALIIRRLKLFFKKYGNTYTSDQIIQAATKYVQSFNGNYQYMKLLKYFIFKEKLNVNGEAEGESELINYIENAGQEEDLRNDWCTTLK